MLKKYFIIFYFISLIIAPALVLAQTTVNPEASAEQSAEVAAPEGIQFKPSIDIPGSIFTSTTTVSGDTLAKYIVAVYRYGGVFAGVVAMFMLVYAGWEWLLAGGNSSKISSAKSKISATLIGLALLFGGYILLSLISKNLIAFDSLNTTLPEFETECPKISEKEACLRVKCLWVPASAEQLRVNETITDYCVSPLVAACPSERELQDINISGLIESPSCSDCRLTIYTINKLKQVVQMLVLDGEVLTVTSAYRTFAKQQELYDCYLAKQRTGTCPCRTCNEAAKPNCTTAPHMTGTAVDVCLRTSDFDSCGTDSEGETYMQAKYNCRDRNDNRCPDGLWEAQDRLRAVMEGACFSPLASEWWHFQVHNCD